LGDKLIIIIINNKKASQGISFGTLFFDKNTRKSIQKRYDGMQMRYTIVALRYDVVAQNYDGVAMQV